MKSNLFLFALFAVLCTIKSARAQLSFDKNFYIVFENGKPNQVSYLVFPSNINIWGNLKVEITGGYNFQQNRGLLRKRFDIVSNAGATSYFDQETVILSASGPLANQWVIGNFDKATSRIPIYHLVSSGNAIVVRVKGTFLHSDTAPSLSNSLTLTAPTTFSGTMPARSYAHSMEPRLGLGTTTPEHRLDVVGKIRAHEILVNTQKTADYVFEDGYSLLPIDSVAAYVKQHKHLPEILSAEEMMETNMSVGAFQIDLLKKIEGLTLYIIDLQGQIKDLKNRDGSVPVAIEE